ncbi:MAG: ABC transporter substrate-binding protein [Sporomusa sp.]
MTVGIIVLLLAVGAWFLFKGQSQTQPAVSQAADRYVVTDAAGRQVEIPRRPKRVVILNASNLEMFYAVGGTVVGRPTTEALPPVVKEAVREVPAVGLASNPNIEQIIGLSPDLILGVNMPFHHNLIPVLDKAGIPILLQSIERYQQIIDTLQFYGELAGRPEQAQTVIAEIQSKCQSVIDRNKNRPAPSVLIVFGSPASFNMATDSSFPGDLVNRLGAVNVVGQYDGSVSQMGYVPLSMEYVAKQNPDMIFLITHNSDAKVNSKLQNELADHPAWRGLKAVADNKVYVLPYNLFAVNPGTQVGDAMTVLAGFLYPEVSKK